MNLANVTADCPLGDAASVRQFAPGISASTQRFHNSPFGPAQPPMRRACIGRSVCVPALPVKLAIFAHLRTPRTRALTATSGGKPCLSLE